MKQQLVRIFLTLAVAASLAQAHFIFVVPEPGGSTAKVFISEELTPDAMVGADMVADAKLSVRDADGNETPLTLTKGEDAYITALPGGGTRLVHGMLDLGFTQRGESTPHLLLYYPKTVLGDAFGANTKLGGDVPVELVPLGEPGAVKLQFIARGKPLAEAEVTVILPDGTQEQVMTDAQGQTKTMTQKGRYGAWARFWEESPGERDGKKYDELRHYAMLVFDAPSAEQSSNAGGEAELVARMPEASASFGAVVSDGWLYVYGGHISPTHSYSTAAVSGKFHRMNLSSPGKWEELPGGPAVQGMNLAAHGGKIYRVGGMEPRNAPGEPSDNHSLTDVARFDPAAGKWEALPPTPEGLSSHDVVVVGDTLVVVGGWEMQGDAGQEWSETVLTMDLSANKLEWKTQPQPFKRRALIAASYDNKVFVIGGMSDLSAVLGEVEIYDPASNAWSEGPDLPGGSANAFAPAAGVHDGRLYVSLGDGSLYRLSQSGAEWEPVGKASPRVAHRVVSSGDTLLVVGGASRGANLDLIEAVTVAEAAR